MSLVFSPASLGSRAGAPGASRIARALRAQPSCCRARRALVVSAGSLKEPGSATLPGPPKKILGFGGCGVDYLASVAAYPKPDAKLRTDTLEVQGGGNCGNALTATARLGLSPRICTKIGGDALGDGIIKEFEEEGVDTTHILRAPGAPSPFTYIIVDRAGGTRTCIHTPSEPLDPEELSEEAIASMLDDVELVYFDGRLTEAAIPVARAARAAGIPVLVELERLRPNLDELAAEADYIFTSAHFPTDWTGAEGLGDALIGTLARLPNAKCMVTTLGTRGSVMLTRTSDTAEEGEGSKDAVLEDLLRQLFKEVNTVTTSGTGASPVCTPAAGGEVYAGQIVARNRDYRLLLKEEIDEDGATTAASSAAQDNADAGNVDAYTMRKSGSPEPPNAVCATVSVSAAAVIDGAEVADTTGAGDAFMGALLYSIVNGLGPAETLRLGAVVAAAKCTALGARPGLPRREAIDASLL